MIIKQIYQLCTCIILFSILLCSSFVSLYFPHFFKFKGSAIHIRTPPCFMDPPMVVAQTFSLHISSSRKNRPEVDFPHQKMSLLQSFSLGNPFPPFEKLFIYRISALVIVPFSNSVSVYKFITKSWQSNKPEILKSKKLLKLINHFPGVRSNPSPFSGKKSILVFFTVE